MTSGLYLISIASYRRPDELRRLLDSLAVSIATSETPSSARIVVVDNDPEGSARNGVEAHAQDVDYTIEPQPGIAAARNRGLQYFDESYAGIIFVDDDEWVDRNWYATITNFASDSGADVVTGPVITELPVDAPSWLRRGSFYQRPRQQSGTRLQSAATNNTLLRREAWVRAGQPTFDTAFSTTGGSDWDFFWGLRKRGADVRYCAEAIVSEDVPPSRLSARWLRQRSVRNGIVNTRVRLKHNEPMALPLARGLVRAAYNAVILLAGIIAGRGLQAKPYNAVLHEYGKFVGLLGYRIHEYRRPA